MYFPDMNSRQRGFTLTELAVVLAIVGFLLGGLMMQLAVQDDLRRIQETQQRLNEARDALIGFAAANGRLPCPATAASNGIESFAVGGSVLNGNCSNFYDGFLPATQLGLSATDANGQLLDSWNLPIRYVIWGGIIGTTSNPLTQVDGIRTATMTSVSSGTLLSICASATGITGANCGAAVTLSNNAPVLLFSIGKNGRLGTPGADEAPNLDADTVFVSHDNSPASAANGEFDDLVIWLSPNILFNRMIAAGRLP